MAPNVFYHVSLPSPRHMPPPCHTPLTGRCRQHLAGLVSIIRTCTLPQRGRRSALIPLKAARDGAIDQHISCISLASEIDERIQDARIVGRVRTSSTSNTSGRDRKRNFGAADDRLGATRGSMRCRDRA